MKQNQDDFFLIITHGDEPPIAAARTAENVMISRHRSMTSCYLPVDLWRHDISWLIFTTSRPRGSTGGGTSAQLEIRQVNWLINKNDWSIYRFDWSINRSPAVRDRRCDSVRRLKLLFLAEIYREKKTKSVLTVEQTVNVFKRQFHSPSQPLFAITREHQM